MSVELDRSKLRSRRKEKGLTQEKLAECAGVSDRHIRSLEKRPVNPSAKVLHGISEALEISMGELLVVHQDKQGKDV